MKDAASAAACEEHVVALWAEWEKHSEAYISLPSQQRKAADQAMAPELMKMRQEVERLEKSDFYGCELEPAL